MLTDTLKKFGYPTTLVKEYKHWLLLCRPKQTTLGSLILIAKSEANRFSELSTESFKEFEIAIKEIEMKLKNCFHYEKINYLMLMMVDPEVHFHIFPRYAAPRKFAHMDFEDKGWPLAPNLELSNMLSEQAMNELISTLKNAFAL